MANEIQHQLSRLSKQAIKLLDAAPGKSYRYYVAMKDPK